jgi:F420-dependent oxidoreductase-like protein
MKFSAWPSVTNPWPDLAEEAKHIDSAGYHTLFVGDHFMHNREDNLGPFMESWSCLAAIAALTSNVRLGTLVTGNTYRNPGVLAKQVAQVDVISGGRVTLGMGAGWQENEHVAFGIYYPPVGERLKRLDESVQIIRSLFQNDRTNFDGQFYQFSNAPLAPKPLQPRLPILIGGGGEKVTLRLVAQYADAWNFPGSPEVFADKLKILEEHCERAGRNPAEINKVGTMMVGFGEPIGGGRPDPQGWHIVEDVRGLTGGIDRFAEAGANEIIFHFNPGRPLPARKETWSAFIQDVAPQYS